MYWQCRSVYIFFDLLFILCRIDSTTDRETADMIYQVLIILSRVLLVYEQDRYSLDRKVQVLFDAYPHFTLSCLIEI